MKEGVEMALNRRPIKAAYFDAVTDTEAESIALEYAVNSARADARNTFTQKSPWMK